MTFWEKYERLCLERGYKPGSTEAADALGTNRGTLSAWKKSGKLPTPDFIRRIADVYGVSADYLLGRTADPVDYTNPDLCAELAGPQLDELGGDIKKAVALQRATADDVSREATRAFMLLYEQLDEMDKVRVEGFIQGLLAQDKYTEPAQGRKKRA